MRIDTTKVIRDLDLWVIADLLVDMYPLPAAQLLNHFTTEQEISLLLGLESRQAVQIMLEMMQSQFQAVLRAAPPELLGMIQEELRHERD